MIKHKSICLNLGGDSYVSGLQYGDMAVLFNPVTKKVWSYAFTEKTGNAMWFEVTGKFDKKWYVLWPEKIGPAIH